MGRTVFAKERIFRCTDTRRKIKTEGKAFERESRKGPLGMTAYQFYE